MTLKMNQLCLFIELYLFFWHKPVRSFYYERVSCQCDLMTEVLMKTSKMFHVDILNFYQEVGNIYLVVILAKYLEKN